MSIEKKQDVLDILNGYQARMQRIKVLRYELENLTRVSATEMIDMMTYGRHNNSSSRSKGDISNKTFYTAMSYQEIAERMNTETAHKIATELFNEEQCQNKLEHYISLLESRQAEIIRLMFFENIAIEDIAARYGRSGRTILRIKDTAIEMLAEMYTYSEQFKN